MLYFGGELQIYSLEGVSYDNQCLALFVAQLKPNYCNLAKADPDPQKVVNVPRIQITQSGCSSKIPSKNLTFSGIENILGWYK